MEAVNKDVKTLLAKLLATEDITVVHKNMPTAYFDTKNRELGLPILKNMSGDIYDLMTLHEVGHALSGPILKIGTRLSVLIMTMIFQSHSSMSLKMFVLNARSKTSTLAVDVPLELVTRNCTGMISLVLQNVTFKNPILLTESIFIPRSVISLV